MPLAAAERRFIKDVRAQLDREEAARKAQADLEEQMQRLDRMQQQTSAHHPSLFRHARSLLEKQVEQLTSPGSHQ
jgi:hypothetical protein